MIYSSLDSSHRDESNDSKIIPIRAIFAEIAIFAKFRVGSGQLSDPTRYFGSVRVGYPDHGSKFGALVDIDGKWLKQLQKRLHKIHYIIIDEKSMVGRRMLGLIDMRLRQAFSEKRTNHLAADRSYCLEISDSYHLCLMFQCTLQTSHRTFYPTTEWRSTSNFWRCTSLT